MILKQNKSQNYLPLIDDVDVAVVGLTVVTVVPIGAVVSITSITVTCKKVAKVVYKFAKRIP